MSTPLVSVIMGIYNCESFLSNAIESVLGQSYTNWELIMCDDCSSDDTLLVARRFQEEHDNITVVSNKSNMRLAYCLNKCLAVARGEYVARMDADDICLPYRFERQVSFLSEHPEYDVVGSAVIPFDEDGEKAVRFAIKEPGVRDLIKSTTFYHPSIMMKKSVYDALGGYLVTKRTQKGQDIDLWFRFFAQGYSGYNLPEPLLKYHESVQDYKKKRDLKSAQGMALTKIHGFRLNSFPFYVYPYALKPIVSALIPKQIMYRYHNTKGG